MKNTLTISNELSRIIQLIERNNIDISSHKSNARTANFGSAAAYLLTNNSNNQTTRSIGQVAAVGGLLYGNNQRNKSTDLELRNFNYLKNAIENLLNFSVETFKRENNSETKRSFLQKLLTVSNYFDEYVKKYSSSVKRKSALTYNSQNLLMTLQNQEVFYYKMRLNEFLKRIDNSILNNNYLQIYNQGLTKINKNKLKKEGYLIIGLIISCFLLGFILIQNSTSVLGPMFFVFALVIYLMHTFYPFLNESKKLKSNANIFVNEILKTVSINKINY